VTSSKTIWNAQPIDGLRDNSSGEQSRRTVQRSLKCGIQRWILPIVAAAALTALPIFAGAQALTSSEDAYPAAPVTSSRQIDVRYVRPTQATMAGNYVFDAFGPYPIAGSLILAGINQETNSPPEWKQGTLGYAKRFGSDFGIAAIGTTTRYGLAEATKEDTLYYRCECRGIGPRLRHAVVSTLTARRGPDGHRVFSLPALVAPYAGSMAGVYGWYPSRFGAKDAFRLGNYSLLEDVGANISLEFLYSGPRSFLARMHLNNSHGSPVEGPNK